MPVHDAPGQMLGYLYQVRYALLLLLENENPNYKICIEKYDDISFEDNGSPIELIQTKHHITNTGSLADGSTDLWRTINSWLDQITDSPELLSSCGFMIITTASTPIGSAASYLMREGRDEKEAIRLLTEDAKKEATVGWRRACNNKFLSANQETLLKLFKSVQITTNSQRIANIADKIRSRVRLSCYSGYENQVMEQLEGWWFREVITALSSPNRVIMDGVELQNRLASIGHQYRPDNLPIERWTLEEELSDEDLEEDQRMFIQQLHLINSDPSILRRALKNYYNAYQQRSSWFRNQLLLPDELEDYDARLVDEWEQCRAFRNSGDAVLQGMELYRELMQRSISIRPLCTEPFVSRGSYEMLSDSLKVGWHRDYLKKLNPDSQKEETQICKNGNSGQ